MSTTTERNRATITWIMEAMSRGDTRPFGEAMAEDFTWHMSGTTAWSGTYAGKADVQQRLLKSLREQWATPYRSTPSRILADGDHVVVVAGMSVREMRRYASLVAQGKKTLRQRLQLLEAHHARTSALIDGLQSALRLIERKQAYYTAWLENGHRPGDFEVSPIQDRPPDSSKPIGAALPRVGRLTRGL